MFLLNGSVLNDGYLRHLYSFDVTKTAPQWMFLYISCSQQGAILHTAQGTFGNIWTHFWMSQLGGAAGIQQAGARDATEHPTMHHTAPTPKNGLAANIKVLRLRNPVMHEGLSTCGGVFLRGSSEVLGLPVLLAVLQIPAKFPPEGYASFLSREQQRIFKLIIKEQTNKSSLEKFKRPQDVKASLSSYSQQQERQDNSKSQNLNNIWRFNLSYPSENCLL